MHQLLKSLSNRSQASHYPCAARVLGSVVLKSIPIRSRQQRRSLSLLELESRLTPATISGQVFYDVNANGLVDAGDTGIAGDVVFLDTNNNAVLDNGPTKNYASTNVPVAISASGTPTITSALSVPDSGTIVDVNVHLNISHTYDSDLTVSLKSPNNTSVTLFSGVGGSGDNFTNTILDDQASTSITAGSPPFTGTYKPSPGTLASFNNASETGTWTLTVHDGADQDGGSLNSWSIDITTTGEPSTITNASGNYSFTGLPDGSYNVVHTIPAGGYVQTSPGGDGRYHISVADGDTFTGNFGDRLPPATISGLVYNDLNANGKQDSGELPVPNVTVYLDNDLSGTLTAGDTTTTSDDSGLYSFTDLVPGKDYAVAEVLPSGFTHISPIRNGLTASPNVNVSKRTGDQSETSITIDPSNPNRVFEASNNINSTGMSGSYSTDGGSTWVNRIFATGADGYTASIGDPTHTFDKFGNLWVLNSAAAASIPSSAVAPTAENRLPPSSPYRAPPTNRRSWPATTSTGPPTVAA